jgi:hypothetical protein
MFYRGGSSKYYYYTNAMLRRYRVGHKDLPHFEGGIKNERSYLEKKSIYF